MEKIIVYILALVITYVVGFLTHALRKKNSSPIEKGSFDRNHSDLGQQLRSDREELDRTRIDIERESRELENEREKLRREREQLEQSRNATREILNDPANRE